MLQHRLGREKNQSSDEKVSSYRSQASHSGIFTYRNFLAQKYHNNKPLNSTSFYFSESITIHPSSSKTSTSISSSGHNLPPEVISQLLATGHLVKEDGKLNFTYSDETF